MKSHRKHARTAASGRDVTDPLADSASAVLAAWALVWNPLVSREEKMLAWEGLGLPGPIEDVEPECWPIYHAAVPSPPVPLLLHSLAGSDGGGAREDWLRAIHHLHLEWNDRVIAPDHLATACEVMAAAVDNDDRVLLRELLARYVEPWCREAAGRVARLDSLAASLVDCFTADLALVAR